MSNEVKDNIKTGVYTRNGEDFTFEFKTSLSVRDKLKFVNSVTETIVGDHYNSIIKDLVFDYMIIAIMTYVDVSEVKEETFDTIGAMERLVTETNIVEIVTTFADDGVIDELRKAVDLDIEYKTGIHRNPISESLSSLLDAIEKKIEGFDVDGMMDMAQAMSGISGELTAEKMLEAYANSDIVKEQYKQLLVKNQERREIIDSAMKEIGIDVVKGSKNAESSILSPIV